MNRARDALLTSMAVPFALEEQVSHELDRFVAEAPTDEGREIRLIAAVVFLFGVALPSLAVVILLLRGRSLSLPLSVLVVVGGLECTALFAAMGRSAEHQRRLAFRDGDSIKIRRIDPEGKCLATASSIQCRVKIARVQLRSGVVGYVWSGWAAILCVGEERMTIACQRTKEEVIACFRMWPTWIGVLPMLEVDEIHARGVIRLGGANKK